ncbi:MAG: VOC family protein [Cyclobacteriaceae bacterium]|nr:VOC family protein [Cyclobacteriaceae bacterium HetDA_MAG_MS6]
MNPVNWFEIPVNDMEKAKSFYEAILDIEISINQMGNWEMGWFPSDKTGTGTTGTLMKSEGYKPSHDGSLVYFHVPNIDNTLSKIATVGGKTLLPKTPIGEDGFIAHFEDCEGNRVALHALA